MPEQNNERPQLVTTTEENFNKVDTVDLLLDFSCENT